MRRRKIRREKWIAVSGGFDPVHIGHVRMMKKAREMGDRLVVILNNDNWLRAKKGFVFMPQKERSELIRAFPFVDKVELTDHGRNDADMSVSRSLRKLKPAVFANGGDRTKKNTPEEVVCKELGITMIFNVGAGGKVQSSSRMTLSASRPVARTVRPWGEYYGWDHGKNWNLKTVYIKPGKRLSLQYHHHRGEYWMLVEGDAIATIQKRNRKSSRKVLKKGEVIYVDKTVVHRLESKHGGTIVEVALGDFDEGDIVRLEDDFGRSPRA